METKYIDMVKAQWVDKAVNCINNNMDDLCDYDRKISNPHAVGMLEFTDLMEAIEAIRKDLYHDVIDHYDECDILLPSERIRDCTKFLDKLTTEELILLINIIYRYDFQGTFDRMEQYSLIN